MQLYRTNTDSDSDGSLQTIPIYKEDAVGIHKPNNERANGLLYRMLISNLVKNDPRGFPLGSYFLIILRLKIQCRNPLLFYLLQLQGRTVLLHQGRLHRSKRLPWRQALPAPWQARLQIPFQTRLPRRR